MVPPYSPRRGGPKIIRYEKAAVTRARHGRFCISPVPLSLSLSLSLSLASGQLLSISRLAAGDSEALGRETLTHRRLRPPT